MYNFIRAVNDNSYHKQFEPVQSMIHGGSWWIGWVEEVPGVNAQEASSIPRHTEINELLALKKGSRFISAMTRK